MTSTTEARRVDSVPTPKLAWRACPDGTQCAEVLLPLDYDEPNGAKTKVALLRRPARDQAHRIGSLFLNPGGPGGSGATLAFVAPKFLSPVLLDRFDVVGVDPRGVGGSEELRCFASTAQQTEALKGFGIWNPVGDVEERAYLASAKSSAVGCSSTGSPLSASMSTAQVARDMDVLRRAVGDRKLTYYGISYGSYLGQVYANMFPDRVRALAIDGVVDPVAWAGTPETASQPQRDRLRAADGESKALHEILSRCERAGEQKCRFARGDAVADFELLANRLKKTPLTVPGAPAEYTYASLIGETSGALREVAGYATLDSVLSDLMILTEPAGSKRATPADRSTAANAFVARAKKAAAFEKQLRLLLSVETLMAVPCIDGLSAPVASHRRLATLATAAEKRAKHFGGMRVWMSATCASNTWTARDEDAYRGPFNRRTAAPILVVGNIWDPATNYEGALKAASLLPNSRLLSSDSWGHGAYGTSRCVTSAMDTYLLTQAVPERGTKCVGDVQPFQDNPANPSTAKASSSGVPLSDRR